MPARVLIDRFSVLGMVGDDIDSDFGRTKILNVGFTRLVSIGEIFGLLNRFLGLSQQGINLYTKLAIFSPGRRIPVQTYRSALADIQRHRLIL